MDDVFSLSRKRYEAHRKRWRGHHSGHSTVLSVGLKGAYGIKKTNEGLNGAYGIKKTNEGLKILTDWIAAHPAWRAVGDA